MPGTHKVGVLVVHGMGTPKHDTLPDGTLVPTYHTAMQKEVTQRVGRLLRDSDAQASEIAWEAVLWHRVLAERQTDLLDRYRRAGTRWGRGRHFALSALGDASAYAYNANKPGSVYERVHQEFSKTIRKLGSRMVDNSCPLVIMSLSLGGIMTSDYIWDRQSFDRRDDADDPLARTPFERLHTLTHFITFGCNIPLFVHAFDPIKAITFPPPNLPAELRDDARWLNFYDEDDVLGYPLEPLCDDYARLASQGWLSEVEINAGGMLVNWNPFSHNHYWTDDEFTIPVARHLAQLLRG